MQVDTPWLAAAELVAVIMMMVNGTFMETIYYRIAIGGIGLFVLGVILKILHIAGADQTIFVASVILVGVYVLHFFTKQSRRVLDICKLVFVIALVVSRLLPYNLRLLHLHWITLENSQVFYWIAELLLWTAFGYFIFDGIRRRTLFKP